MNKRFFSILTILLFTLVAQAQAPKALKYRTIVRDAAGRVLDNQQVTIGLDLVQKSTTIYAENHALTTNAAGLVNLEIGRGTIVESGVFSRIDWELPTQIRVYLDSKGGSNLQELGTADLESLIKNGIEANLSNGGGTIYINDAADNAVKNLEQIANPEKGDLAYYDGSTWRLLPKGDYSQIIALGETGTKYSTSVSPSAQFKVTLPQGNVLYVHPTDNNVSLKWSASGINIKDLSDFKTADEADKDFNGWDNNVAIVAQLGSNNNENYAAKLCSELVAEGFDDWYLPAAGELNEIFKQLGPTTYGGNGLMTNGFYWSSSELIDDGAWGQGFLVGNRGSSSKISDSRCRCVRKEVK
ncbi:MAG: hypothetical protein ACKVT2_05160 [Saprospiraceae bacterium]